MRAELHDLCSLSSGLLQDVVGLPQSSSTYPKLAPLPIANPPSLPASNGATNSFSRGRNLFNLFFRNGQHLTGQIGVRESMPILRIIFTLRLRLMISKKIDMSQ